MSCSFQKEANQHIRLRTHTIFSFGLILFFLQHFQIALAQHVVALLDFSDPLPFYVIDVFICYLLAWMLNFFIDAFGHYVAGPGIIHRSWRTHSIFTAPLWGALLPLAIVAVPSWLFGVGFPSETYLVGSLMLLGIIVALSHLLLDILTPDGIYLTKHWHVRTVNANGNGLFINWLLAGVGVFLALLALVPVHYLLANF